MAVDSLMGSLLVARLGNWRRGPLLIDTNSVTGLGLLLLAAFPYYLAGVAVMVLLGLGSSPQRPLKESLAMDAVDDKYRGRVMSVLMMSIASGSFHSWSFPWESWPT